ncbi:AI-2E family transporter [Thermoflexibacter ruber]|uniref:Predicted PurR-regulated permease PerM n=1 Tax=Thermoflexibacter ruber TaxID=1003 RepID=A0A1I2INL7_9BACT|nr:AI-2E family transporter [Thermoflexibacter ruber]SFF42647.1 Predicted PurR-regulated permease PerM [Thermoflexibacter ruber]
MENEKTPIQLPFLLNAVLVLVGLIAFFFVLDIGAGILIPLVFSFIFSLFLYPLCRKLEGYKIPRALAILICLLLVIAVLSLVFWMIYENILSFSADLPKMQERGQELVTSLQKFIEETFQLTSEGQIEWLRQNLRSFVNTGGQMLNGVINTTTNFLAQIFLIPVYTFFILLYRHVFKGFLDRVFDVEHHEKVGRILVQIETVIQKYIVGLITVVSIIAVLNVIGLMSIGIKHAVFFGVFAAFLTIIPYIGIFIGSLLPILYALAMTDSLFYPVAVLIWFQIVQVLEGNVITPNIVGSQVSINPLVAMLALLLGGSLWGIAGMIIFVPLTAMLKVVLDNIPALSPYGFLLSEGENKVPKFKSNLFLKKLLFWEKKKTE